MLLNLDFELMISTQLFHIPRIFRLILRPSSGEWQPRLGVSNLFELFQPELFQPKVSKKIGACFSSF